MASIDYASITDAASTASIIRGVLTAATIPIPAGGGSFVYAGHSITNAPGCFALYYNAANFTPTTKGADFSAAVFKGGAGGSLFSAYVFVNLNGTASTNSAYMLGLSDSEPAHLELRKGPLSGGLPDQSPGGNSILRRSTATFALGTWLHIRLECVLEPTGDVICNVFQNDLSLHDVTSPVWVPVAGMASFTDDFLQVATGSAPLANGYMGFGSTMAEVGRVAAFDQLAPARQLTP